MIKEQALSQEVKDEYQKELDLYKSEMFEYLKTIYTGSIERDHKKENYIFDFYISEKNTVIDCLSLYFDSELYRQHQYNQNKFKYLKENNIKLIQFMSCEWFDKKEICKNIIKNKLGLSEIKVNARNCTIEIVIGKRDDIVQFVDKFHLQGHTRYKSAFILRDKFTNEIYEILTLRSPFTRKWCGGENLEIARFCVKKDTSVRGGFNKILSVVLKWCKDNGYKNLLTYSSCSYSWGATYEKSGAKFLFLTPSMYGYTCMNNEFKSIEGRFKNRAKDGLTEKQCAENKGIFRMYTVGNYAWLYELNKEIK